MPYFDPIHITESVFPYRSKDQIRREGEKVIHQVAKAAEIVEMEAADAAIAAWDAYGAGAPADAAGHRAASRLKESSEEWAGIHEAFDNIQAAGPRGITRRVCSSLSYPKVWC
jgi:hypothetical protein